jgi:hypothetical protein
VIDAELVVFQTLCGLRVSPRRPVTDKEEEITCSVCRQIAVEQANLKAPPQVEKKVRGGSRERSEKTVRG